MTDARVLVWFVVLMGVASTALVVVVALTRLVRTTLDSVRQARVAPYRAALLAVASGEDDAGDAVARLRAVPARTWTAVRDLAVSLLGKVRGDPAAQLVALLDGRGELDRARTGVRSPSAVRRARNAHLLGLAGRVEDAAVLVPLLTDRAAEVRLVAARSLGLIGAPEVARDLFAALRPVRRRPGIPTAVAAEAVLGLGAGAVPAVAEAMRVGGLDERVVATLVAADGALSATVPRLRELLAADPAMDVRTNAARALGAAGGPADVAALAEYTAPGEPAELRRAAAAALGELGDPGAAPVLAGLLGDPDVRLAQVSGDALVHLGDEGTRLVTRTAGAGGRAGRIAAGALTLDRLRRGVGVR